MWLERVTEAYAAFKQKAWQEVSLKHYCGQIDIILSNEHTPDITKAERIWRELFNMKHNIYMNNPKTGELTAIGHAFLQTQEAVDALLSKENIPTPAWVDNVVVPLFPSKLQVAA